MFGLLSDFVFLRLRVQLHVEIGCWRYLGLDSSLDHVVKVSEDLKLAILPHLRDAVIDEVLTIMSEETEVMHGMAE